MTAPTTTRTAAQNAEHETLTRKARRAYRSARRGVPLSAVLAVATGTIALAGGALDVDGATRTMAAVAFAFAASGFAFAVHAVATYQAAAPQPDLNTEENQ